MREQVFAAAPETSVAALRDRAPSIARARGEAPAEDPEDPEAPEDREDRWYGEIRDIGITEAVSDEELYVRLLSAFPSRPAAARRMGLTS